jgi:hypothetical protein
MEEVEKKLIVNSDKENLLAELVKSVSKVNGFILVSHLSTIVG